MRKLLYMLPSHRQKIKRNLLIHAGIELDLFYGGTDDINFIEQQIYEIKYALKLRRT